jgi:hypothetical protein
MDIASLGIASVGAITMLTLLVAQGIKATSIDNKWLPVLCGAIGCVLGIAGLYVMPDFPASDIITAAAVGAASGFAATGINQVYKQLSGDE